MKADQIAMSPRKNETDAIENEIPDLSSLRVLVVDDEPDVLLGLKMIASSVGANVFSASSGEEAIREADAACPHVVVTDITMPGISGLELLSSLKRERPHTLVVMITGFATIDLAVNCMRRGASHFIAKPFDNEEIVQSIRSLGTKALIDEKVRKLSLRETIPSDSVVQAGGFVVHDPKMRDVLDLVAQVAPTSMNVLIQGESGTGKELIAREIHRRSALSERNFLAVNTAALPDTLLESELFGHRRGAFTGADRDRLGIFREAEGGTVFLDEIGLMSPMFQGKLLRVLQERTVIPLGTSTAVPVKFRLITATSQTLKERIEKGEFREDLYYRLQVVTIDIPPLRERKEDIIPLAVHFLRTYEGLAGESVGGEALSDEACHAMLDYPWLGNVRELENAIQRALMLCRGGIILPQHLGIEVEGFEAVAIDENLSYEEGKQKAVERFQRKFIIQTLEKVGGNVTQAAQAMGITRAGLQRIMRSLNVSAERFKS
ncbi:MAG: sigma-54 dependent transcriptional regulator [Planctomycetes bacterium]|nr:sigma-54 dependent transcriptional regulator [Planctomycetota bacterium]